MANFEIATRVEGDGNQLSAHLDAEWFILGPFGGYLAAMALRACAAPSAHKRAASFSCQFIGVGKEGPLSIEVELVRSGRRATCSHARISQNGKTLVTAQTWFVSDDLDGLDHTLESPPEYPKPDDLPVYEFRRSDNRQSLPMWNYMERRVIPHDQPIAKIGTWHGWHRMIEDLPVDDEVLRAAETLIWMDLSPWNAIGNAHAWPPSHLTPTLDLTLQFQRDLYEKSPTKWQLASADSAVAGAGLAGARGQIWSQDGDLQVVGTTQCLCTVNRFIKRSPPA